MSSSPDTLIQTFYFIFFFFLQIYTVEDIVATVSFRKIWFQSRPTLILQITRFASKWRNIKWCLTCIGHCCHWVYVIVVFFPLRPFRIKWTGVKQEAILIIAGQRMTFAISWSSCVQYSFGGDDVIYSVLCFLFFLALFIWVLYLLFFYFCWMKNEIDKLN